MSFKIPNPGLPTEIWILRSYTINGNSSSRSTPSRGLLPANRDAIIQAIPVVVIQEEEVGNPEAKEIKAVVE